MRTLPILLLLLCVSTANAGLKPITSFAPDTTADRARGDKPDVPVWLGIQCSPVVGDTWQQGEPRAWDTEGMPWLALSAAWPMTSPHEVWLAVGYERWRYRPRTEWVSFAPGLLALIDPVKLDQATVRTGVDRLIGRGHTVSGAIGAGVGMGLGYTRIGDLPGTDWSIYGEALAHALAHVSLDERTRFGAGVSTGFAFDVRHGGDALWNWQMELRLERAVGGGRNPGH